MAFKPVKVETVDVQTISRIQANIAAEFAAIEQPTSLGITPVASSRSLTTYPATSTDRYVIVDTSASALKVSLPVPGNQQLISIIKGSGTSALTVVVSTGGKFGDGSSSITVTDSVTLLADGSNWWKI